MKKRIAILGSTGSIGRQTLEVIASHPDTFQVEVLTAQNNVDLLIKQALEFNPNSVVIANKKHYKVLSEALESTMIKVFAGDDAICQIVDSDDIDIVVTALVGFAGLKPTISAIRSGKQLALANKETLVVASHIINELCSEHNTKVIPVDSEHSAIFQCLAGEKSNEISKIILTASGGPFLNKSLEELKQVYLKEALRHPNWDMGCKITIDSASMMNKGLEVIEAKWLFDLKPEQIDVLIHPQSIIHSMVEFTDRSVKAQMGLPDMRIPIQYALTYPQRIKSSLNGLDFMKYPSLTFEEVDLKKFRNLALAFEALKMLGNIPCILNAANEISVSLFLKKRIRFTDMPLINEHSMEKMPFIKDPSLDDLFETDNETRKYALELVKNKF